MITDYRNGARGLRSDHGPPSIFQILSRLGRRPTALRAATALTGSGRWSIRNDRNEGRIHFGSGITLLITLLLFIAFPAKAGEDRYGLVFVYRADCPASRAFSLSLKAVSDRLGLTVLPVSMDGLRFEEWPGTIRDGGQAAKLRITRVPFLAVYDMASRSLRPITLAHLPELPR